MNKLTYLLIGVITFLAFLIIMAPAATVVSAFEDDLQASVPGMTLTGIRGSLWQGESDLSYGKLPPVLLNWELSALPLLTGTANTHLEFSGTGLSAEVDGAFSDAGGEISQLNATITGDYLNQVTIDYGLELSGEVQLTETSLGFDQQWLTHASGRLTWSGGIVHIETPQQIHTVKLPPLDASVSMSDRDLIMQVTEAGREMMNIAVRQDGWAKVDISYTFMEMVNLPLPGGILSDGQAVTLEEKIL